MNIRDSEVIAGLLRNAGCALVDVPEKADVVIFNTCSVRQHAEDKVWSEVGRIAKSGRKIASSSASAPRRPTAGRVPGGTPCNDEHQRRPIIGLVGCMAQNYKEEIFRRAPQVDFVVGPADIGKIPEVLEKFVKGGEIASSSGRVHGTPRNDERQVHVSRPTSYVPRNLMELRIWETDGLVRPEEMYHTGYRQDRDHAYVVISEGCSNFCSYCVVPYTRGELRHRSHEEIVREVREAVAQGITKVTLLGQNVNAYVSTENPDASHSGDGRVLPYAHPRSGCACQRREGSPVTFFDLLREVNAVRGLEELSFITSHPKDTTPELFQAIARLDKLKKFLHLPVQSGSDRILNAMRRGYTAKYYYALAEKYRTIVPEGVLTTDIIVGYPGETVTDFRRTYELVERVRFNAAFIFKYSPRPGTAASKLADDVPQQEKERRHALVLELQRKISKSKR